jgi:hypothetical protein
MLVEGVLILLGRLLTRSIRAVTLLGLALVSGPAHGYDVFNYNCHNYANDSDKIVDECRGNVWGVFSCFGNRALSDPLRYHTATWVYVRPESKMCIIEPQNPLKRHCWKATALEAATELPDVRGNPEAREGARLICNSGFGKQWRDPRSLFVSEANCSKPLPPGVWAAQPGPVSCAKQTLGLRANQVCKKLNPADLRDPEVLRQNGRCNACCDDQAVVWEKPRSLIPGGGKYGATYYWGTCTQVCDAVFQVSDTEARKVTRVARRMNELLSTRWPWLRGSSEADRRKQKSFIQEYVEPSKTSGSAGQSRSAR